MQVIGLIGLGEKGYLLAKALQARRIKILAFDLIDANRLKAANNGIVTTSSISGVVMHLPPRKIICLTLEIIEERNEVIPRLLELLNENDIIIDASNTENSERLNSYNAFYEKGIHFVSAVISNNIIEIKSDNNLIPINKMVIDACGYFAVITN